MVAGWNPFLFLKHQFHILHFPNSTGLFTKPTGHHYTKYRFSPDIAKKYSHLVFLRIIKSIRESCAIDFWDFMSLCDVHMIFLKVEVSLQSRFDLKWLHKRPSLPPSLVDTG
jgi:hypothetical protein